MSALPSLPRSLQAAALVSIEKGIANGRLDRFAAWSPLVRNAVLERLWDAGYLTFAAGADRIVVPMTWADARGER